jgi:hypothetical protein
MYVNESVHIEYIHTCGLVLGVFSLAMFTCTLYVFIVLHVLVICIYRFDVSE